MAKVVVKDSKDVMLYTLIGAHMAANVLKQRGISMVQKTIKQLILAQIDSVKMTIVSQVLSNRLEGYILGSAHQALDLLTAEPTNSPGPSDPLLQHLFAHLQGIQLQVLRQLKKPAATRGNHVPSCCRNQSAY